MRVIASAAVCVVLFTAIASAGTLADCSTPAVMSDDWPVSPPAQQGLDPQLICSIGPGLAKATEGLLVQRIACRGVNYLLNLGRTLTDSPRHHGLLHEGLIGTQSEDQHSDITANLKSPPAANTATRRRPRIMEPPRWLRMGT